MFAARLVAYNPDGERLPVTLADPVSWDASFAFNDVGSLTLSYATLLEGRQLLDRPVEIAVQVSDGTRWVEPRNGRFIAAEDASDPSADFDVPSFTFRSYATLMDRAMVASSTPATAGRYDSDGKRNFLSASPGQILLSVLQEARSEYSGLLPALTTTFSASKDSRGNAWANLTSVAYEPGMSMLDVAGDLASYGLIDWWLEGRDLVVVNAGSTAVDRNIRLNLTDVMDSPVRGSWEGMYTHIRVEGKDGRIWERPVPGANVPHGAKVKVIANNSVSSDGTALSIINQEIQLATKKRTEYTRSIAVFDRCPMVDYQLGDTVEAKDATDAWERMRIFELGLEWEADGEKNVYLGARLTLNDRFVDAEVRQAKRMKGIVHGATQTMGDGGIPSRSDKAIPAAPQGVAANSLGYWQDVIPLSSVDVSWQAVTADVDGLALNGVEAYEVRVGGQTKRVTGTSAGFDGLQPSRIYEVTVRAISTTGIAGRWSARKQVTTAYPLPNLDPPTAPTFRTESGAFQAIWDGKLKGSGAAYDPPKHFSHILVEIRKVGTTGWVRYARDTGSVLTGLTAGDRYDVRFIAVDVLDNESEPGPTARVTIESSYQKMQERADGIAEDLEAEKQRVTQAVEDIFTLNSSVNEVAGKARDAFNAAVEAQEGVAQAIANSENLWAWTSEWRASGPGLTIEPRRMTADQSHTGTYDNRAVGMSKPYPAERRYRIIATVSNPTTGEGRVRLGAYKNTASGSYVSSIWPAGSAKTIPAGADRIVHSVDFEVAYSGTEAEWSPVLYLDYANLVMEDVRVIDSTDIVAAEQAAAEAMAKAEAAQTTANQAKEDATEAVLAANGKNKIYRSTGVPGSTKGTTAGDVWWRFANANFTGPVIGQWTWSGSAWVASTIGSQIIESLTVDKLSVTGAAKMPVAVINQFTSDEAFIRNVYTNLVVVAPNSLVTPLSDGSDAQRVGWKLGGGARWPPDARGARLHWGDGTSDLDSQRVQVSPGARYRVEATVAKGGTGTAPSYAIQALFYDSTGAYVSYTNAKGYSTDTGQVEGTFTVPNDIYQVVLRFRCAAGTAAASYWLVHSITCIQQVGATLIEPGAVTTPLIAAGSIIGDHMSVGALDAFRIRSPLFESVAAANRGIKWVGSEFVAWDNSGKEMFRLSGNTGEISGMTFTGGVIRTAASGERIWMGIRNDNLPGIEFYDATRRRVSYGFSTGKDPGIWMYDASGTERLRLNSTGSMTMFAPNGVQSFSVLTENDSTYGRAWLQGPAYGSYRPRILLGRSTVDGTVTSLTEIQGGSGNSDQSWMRVTAGGSWWLGSSTRGRISMDNSSGELMLYPRSNLLSLYGIPNTTSTGMPLTQIVSASGKPTTYRQTSLRAAKTNIEDIPENDIDRLMDLRPRVFHDRTAWEEYSKGLEAAQLQRDGLTPGTSLEIWEGTAKPRPVYGFIAEEVVEILPNLGAYNGDGSLAGVQYDRTGALTLAWLQKHWPALVARVEQLERE